MALVYVTGPCAGCRRVFAFNPFRVPSVPTVHGTREPICVECVALVNPARIANGLDPIVPHPRAYEPVDDCEWC